MKGDTSIKYEIKDNRLHFNFQCEECGTISNSIPYSKEYILGDVLQPYLIKHSHLHELATTGELTKKFITMVKGV